MRFLLLIILSTSVCQVARGQNGINTRDAVAECLQAKRDAQINFRNKCAGANIENCKEVGTQLQKCKDAMTGSVQPGIPQLLAATMAPGFSMPPNPESAGLPICSKLTSDKFEKRLSDLKRDMRDNRKEIADAQKDLHRDMKTLEEEKAETEKAQTDLAPDLAEKLEAIDAESVKSMDELQKALDQAEDSIQSAAIQKLSLQQEQLKATAEFAAKVQVQTDKIISLSCEAQTKKTIKDLMPKGTGSLKGTLAINQKVTEAAKEQYRVCWESAIKQRNAAYQQYQTTLQGLKEQEVTINNNVERAQKLIADMSNRRAQLQQKTEKKKADADAHARITYNQLQTKLNRLNDELNKAQFTNTFKIIGLQQDSVQNSNELSLLYQKQPEEGTTALPKEALEAYNLLTDKELECPGPTENSNKVEQPKKTVK